MDDTTVEASRRGPSCPSDAQLASFASGDTAVGVDLAEHIATCDACRAFIVEVHAGGRSEPPPTLPARTMVGRYRIESCLGTGGMGVVYRALDVELDRSIALKLVHARSGRNPEELADRLRRESRLQARVKHPAVITVHDIGRDPSGVFVAMELIEGVTLRAWLAHKRRRWREIVEVFSRAGGGLAAAHAAGLVHRDFKPDNVLVEEHGGQLTRVSVTDFGVARALEGGPPSAPGVAETGNVELTLQGTLLGTPAYMAPEQLHGGPVDARADIFAFAVALWQALYGVRPYPGETIATIAAAMEDALAPPRDHATRDRPPRGMIDVLAKALAVEPDARTPTMTELLHVIASLQHRRRAWIAAGIATAALAGAAALVATHDAGESPYAGGDRLAGELAAVRDRVAGEPDPAVRAGLTRALDRYIATWIPMRTRACLAADPAAVRCFDANAGETAAVFDAILALPADQRRIVARTSRPIAACASAAAETLANLEPPPALAARVARVRVALAVIEQSLRTDIGAPSIASASAVADEARAIGFAPLVHEVAFVRAEIEVARTGQLDALRDVAASADRGGHVVVALRSAIVLLDELMRQNEKLDRVRDTLAHAEALMARVGNPPEQRAYLQALRGFIAALDNDAPTARSLATDVEAQLTDVDVALIELLAHTYFGINDLPRAEAMLRRYLEIARRDPLISPGEVLVLRDAHALLLAISDRAAEAAAELQPIFDELEHDRRLVGSPAFGAALKTLAFAYNSSEAYDRALAVIDRWRPSLAKSPGTPSFVAAKIAIERATALMATHHFDEAERECAFGLEVLIERSGASAPEAADARILHGQALAELHQLDAARAELERGIADLAKVSADDPGRVAQGQIVLADVMIQQHREADAAPLVEHALVVYQNTRQPASEIALAELTLARAIAGRDRPRARALARHALSGWTKDPGTWTKEIALARGLAGD